MSENPRAFHGSDRPGFTGVVAEDHDPRFPSTLYEIDGRSTEDQVFSIEKEGAVFVYVQSGPLTCTYPGPNDGPYGDEDPESEINSLTLLPGEYAVFPRRVSFAVGANGVRAVAIQRVGWLGLQQFGGPIEGRGRLRYIDGCSDTLLVAPPKMGDPCLNLLYFPPGINQTAHTHPSVRMGIVAKGRGKCHTNDGTIDLYPGLIFTIPTDCHHGFETEDESMTVIAYHPDSDFGPTDETHPMVNRTLVGGDKIDNTAEAHKAEVVDTRI